MRNKHAFRVGTEYYRYTLPIPHFRLYRVHVPHPFVIRLSSVIISYPMCEKTVSDWDEEVAYEDNVPLDGLPNL